MTQAGEWNELISNALAWMSHKNIKLVIYTARLFDSKISCIFIEKQMYLIYL